MAVLAGADDKKEQVNAVSGRYSKKSRGILYFVGKHIYILCQRILSEDIKWIIIVLLTEDNT